MRRSPQHISLTPVPPAYEHAIASVEASAASGSRERTHSLGNTFYRDMQPKPVRGLRVGERGGGGGGGGERSGGRTTRMRDVLSHPSTLRNGVCAFVCLVCGL